MAASASYSGVFAFKDISGELVIEGLGVPFDEREILAIVLGVAARALVARSARKVVGSVESLASGQSSLDFSVAFETLQSGRGAQLVASRAIRGTVQRLVSPRKRAGRDLRPRRRQEP